MLNTKLEAIADAIRYKRNSINNYYLNEMPNEINNIGDRVQPYKVVNYSQSGTYTVTPDNGYDTLNSVIVGVQAGGQDLSNLIIWDTTSQTGRIGSNVRDLSSAFINKSFSSVADALTLPNYGVNMYDAFHGAQNVNLSFQSNTTFKSLDYCFQQSKFTSTNVIQNVLDAARNSVALRMNWAFRQASSEVPGVVEIGNRLDNVLALAYLFYRPGSMITLNNINMNFSGDNVILHSTFETVSIATPNSIASLKGSVYGTYPFTNVGNLCYLDANIHENYTISLVNGCNSLFGEKIVHGWGWMNNSVHMVIGFGNSCPSLRSVDYKLHNRTSDCGYCSMPFFNQTFFNDMNLSDVWMDLSELDNFSPAGSTAATHYCLQFVGTFRLSNNIERVFIDYPTYNNFFNVLFQNTFFTLVTTKKHEIILSSRHLYNRVLAYNAAVFSGAMTFTEETVDDNIVFNFYNENNMVNYTKSVHVVRCAYNTTKNVYVYCTE